MKAWRIAAVLACAVAGTLAVPAGAAAKPGYGVVPAGFFLAVDLPKSNGYKVYLGSVDHRRVELVAYRNGELAFYLAKGKVNRHGIDVDFGRFGHVRAEFEGRPVKSEPVFPGCKGRGALKARGRLEGSFRFRGEGGYFDLSTERAKASYERSFRQVCWFGPESPQDRELVDVLEATGKVEGRRVNFTATHIPPIGVPVIRASITERIGRVTAFRLTTTTDEGDVLEFSPPRGRPQTVTVKPVFPFRGSASYTVLPDGSSEWSGDLRAPLAGLGQVPLTGPSFKANACRISLSEAALMCERQSEAAQGPNRIAALLYGSGPHSQPFAR